MTAYYNEHDKYAAQWLRNLISAGAIASGEVDERSIEDVQAGDLKGFTQCHFFAGIGGWSYALRLAGWPDDRPVWTGSCPCQPFSVAGTGASANDERHLWPAWFSLIAERRPAIIFGEQVEAAIGWGWLDLVCADLESKGYAIGATVLPACSVGAPHIRNRLWFVAHANGGDASAEGIQRGGQQRLESQDSRPLLLADSLRPAGGGRTGGVPRAQAQSGGERFENGNLFDRLGAGGADGLIVADAAGPRRQSRRRLGTEGGRKEARIESGRLRAADELADTDTHGRQVERAGRLHDNGPSGDDALRCGRMGNAEDSGRPEGDKPDEGTGQGPSDAGLMGNAERARLEGFSGDGANGSKPGRHGEDAGRSIAEAGTSGGVADAQHDVGRPDLAVRRPQGRKAGFWSDTEWLYCTDGKARPVEAGTFPLAHGVRNRVGQLRAYGNAVVPQVAAEFISAFLEAQ